MQSKLLADQAQTIWGAACTVRQAAVSCPSLEPMGNSGWSKVHPLFPTSFPLGQDATVWPQILFSLLFINFFSNPASFQFFQFSVKWEAWMVHASSKTHSSVVYIGMSLGISLSPRAEQSTRVPSHEQPLGHALSIRHSPAKRVRNSSTPAIKQSAHNDCKLHQKMYC